MKRYSFLLGLVAGAILGAGAIGAWFGIRFIRESKRSEENSRRALEQWHAMIPSIADDYFCRARRVPVTEEETAEYRYRAEDGSITIAQYMGTNTTVTVPSSIRGWQVTSIGVQAFEGQRELTRVTIPNGITNIGDCAFENCTKLASITIPASVVVIGDGAFNECTSLTNIVIPNRNAAILPCAFFHCSSMTNFMVPADATSIGYGWFELCDNLVNVSIPNSVTNIEFEAFWGCTNLASIKIPNLVRKIGGCAFGMCTHLESITIPVSVEHIGEWAFRDCGLTSVWFEGDAPETDPDVFTKCPNTTIYHLPNTTGWSNTFAGRPTAIWNPQTNAIPKFELK